MNVLPDRMFDFGGRLLIKAEAANTNNTNRMYLESKEIKPT